MTIWPLGLIPWGAFEWMRDIGDYRDTLEQWRDDVAEWEFERWIDASRA